MGARQQRRSRAGRDAGFGFAIETHGEMAVEVGHVLKEGESGRGEHFPELAFGPDRVPSSIRHTKRVKEKGVVGGALSLRTPLTLWGVRSLRRATLGVGGSPLRAV